jgi:Membrane-bound serine protease (ClpP class)
LACRAAPAHKAIQKGDVVVVPLHGEVAPSLLAFLRRAVKTAESNDASAIVFDMNTYGGRLDTATEIVNALNQIKIPTYTFINTTQDPPARSLSSPRNTFTWRRSAQLARLHRSFRRAKICPPQQRKNDFVLVCTRPRLGHQERP